MSLAYPINRIDDNIYRLATDSINPSNYLLLGSVFFNCYDSDDHFP